MESIFNVSLAAQEDLFDIWRHIAGDSVSLADRIESEIYQVFKGRRPRALHRAFQTRHHQTTGALFPPLLFPGGL